MNRTYAHRLIESSRVIGNLLPIGNKPTNEAQARPLTKLPTPEMQQEARKKVIEIFKPD